MENKLTMVMEQYFVKWWLILFLILEFFPFFPLVASAAEQDDSYSPDRPGVTNDPGIQQKNSLSIEVGIMNFAHKSREYSFAETLLRVGIIAEILELRFAWDGFFNNTNASGAGDICLGTKIKFLNQDKATFDVGLLADVVLNVGADEFSAEGNDTSLLLMASRDVSENMSYTGNYGVNFFKDENDWQTDYSWTSALDFSLTESLSIFGEIFGDFGNNEKSTFSIGGGIYQLLASNLQVDASFGIGLSNTDSDWFASVGFALKLPK